MSNGTCFLNKVQIYFLPCLNVYRIFRTYFRPTVNHTFVFTDPVLMGAELNILDFEGHVDLDEYYLKKIDYAVASLHTPCIDNNGSVADYTRAYLNVLENPYVNIIGHPDDSRLPADWTEVAKAAARNHKLLEVNNTSLNPLGARKGAKDNYKELLAACIRYGTSIIIDSDAHCEADVGNHSLAHAFLEEMHFPEELIVNTSLGKAAPFIPKLKQLLSENEAFRASAERNTAL